MEKKKLNITKLNSLRYMTCIVEGCERTAFSRWKGLGPYCIAHHSRMRKGISLDAPIKERIGDAICAVGSCYRSARSKHKGKGPYCFLHLKRSITGVPLDLPIRKRRRRYPGDLRLHSLGYVEIRMSDGEWKMLHRIMMQNHLGRKLFDHEEVHHKNGQKNDNRMNNFELWGTNHPRGQRVEDKVEFSVEMLEMYSGFLTTEQKNILKNILED